MLDKNSIWHMDSLLQSHIKEVLDNSFFCNMRYQPFEPENDILIELISQLHGISKDSIFMTAGISGAIFSIIRSCFWDKIFLLTPEFGLYDYAISNSKYRNKVNYIEVFKEKDIIDYFKKKESTSKDLLCFSNPRWFTGELISKQLVMELMEIYKGVLFIDEAYIDFAINGNELFNNLHDCKRVIFARSFSKGYFLPGLRIGYMVSNGLETDFRKSGVQPHQISSPSYVLAESILKDDNVLRKINMHRTYVKKLRVIIEEKIIKHPEITIMNSQANFGSIFWRNTEISEEMIKKLKNVSYVNWPTTGFRYPIWNVEEANRIIEVINSVS
jgi:histidinol-phosphate/aromatic aminotransferase/cobyric acid decarboxylase-like protein